jgi:hypothetical protein
LFRSPELLSLTDTHGQRRIDDPADWVYVEIEAAIHPGIRIVPVLIEGARMPDRIDLPAALHWLIIKGSS